MLNKIINSIGLGFDIIGAVLVAWEVVQQYEGKKHRDGVSFDELSDGPQETPEFQQWQKTKYFWMKLGLACLVVGFLLQILSNWIGELVCFFK